MTSETATRGAPRVHPVVASVAREVLNKSENERSGVLSTAMSYLGLYGDPVIAAVTFSSDWRIAELFDATPARRGVHGPARLAPAITQLKTTISARVKA